MATNDLSLTTTGGVYPTTSTNMTVTYCSMCGCWPCSCYHHPPYQYWPIPYVSPIITHPATCGWKCGDCKCECSGYYTADLAEAALAKHRETCKARKQR